MYVCLCKAVTDADIRRAAENGANSIKDLRLQLGVSSQCGKCACMAKDLLADYQRELDRQQHPLWAMA